MAFWSKRPRWGMVLLGVWLILTGLVHLTTLSFTGMNTVLGILALAAGVLILLER